MQTHLRVFEFQIYQIRQIELSGSGETFTTFQQLMLVLFGYLLYISIGIYLDHDKAQAGFSSVNSIPTFVGFQHLGMVPYRKIGVGSSSSY